jgi:hypothetical protein
MANVTIDNTSKSGFLKLSLGDYYSGENGEELEHWIRISDDFIGLCIKNIEGSLAVELHISHEDNIFCFNYIASSGTLVVDTVNGVAPTSLNDLRDKILALIP